MFGTRRDTQTIRPQPNIIRDGTPAYRAHLAPAILNAVDDDARRRWLLTLPSVPDRCRCRWTDSKTAQGVVAMGLPDDHTPAGCKYDPCEQPGGKVVGYDANPSRELFQAPDRPGLPHIEQSK